MGRLVGIDYGSKRVGVAITDLNKVIATPLKTFAASEIFQFLVDYNSREDIEGFVVGFPLNLEGNATDATGITRQFVKKLQKEFPEKAIHLQDERFTSKMAVDAMVRGGMKKKDRRNKANIDKISAALILQSFLERSR